MRGSGFGFKGLRLRVWGFRCLGGGDLLQGCTERVQA